MCVNQGSTLSELGVEKQLINNVFKSSENPELINKHEPKRESKSKFIRLSKMDPEDELFCTMETNPEIIFLMNEEIGDDNLPEHDNAEISIKPPLSQIEPDYLPITLDTDESLLRLIPCNAKLKINEPSHLGIGKQKALMRR